MTGYGSASFQKGERALTIEIRSVNQRFLDIRFSMPRDLLPWETELRSIVQAHVARGKLDISINRAGTPESEFSVDVNLPLAKAYIEALTQLRKALKIKSELDLAPLMNRPELLRVSEKRRDAQDDIEFVKATLLKAVQSFNRDREREGKALGKDMLERVRRLQRLQSQISTRVRALTPQLAQRLRERLSSLLEGREINEERLLQEVALITDRSDVTEELVRLKSHLAALLQLPRSTEPIGKRLDFLLQEIHREFNTISSKSADLDVTNSTIEARGEIEKLKEQAQNIE